MNITRFLLLAIACGMASPAVVAAEDSMPKTTKHSNPKFYTALHIRFKPGKVDEGRKIISEFFEVAGVNSKNGAIAFNPQTGDWHHIVYFPWSGPSDIEYQIPPSAERWWSELAKVSGSPRKALELMAKFVELVAAEKYDIVLRSA